MAYAAHEKIYLLLTQQVVNSSPNPKVAMEQEEEEEEDKQFFLPPLTQGAIVVGPNDDYFQQNSMNRATPRSTRSLSKKLQSVLKKNQRLCSKSI